MGIPTWEEILKREEYFKTHPDAKELHRRRHLEVRANDPVPSVIVSVPGQTKKEDK